MSLAIEKTVSDIAVEHPASLRIFEQLGIDYCCGGKKRLSEVCGKLGLSVDEVLQRIEKAEAADTAVAATDWSLAPLADLCKHIVRKHHTFVRAELERLDKIVKKVFAVHGEAHPELLQVRDYFNDLNTDMTSHMFKEEHVLFPYIEKMERAASGSELPPACFSSVQQPITAMMNEHDIAGSLMAQMRSVTRGYTLPEGACGTYRAMYEGLQDFERDLHQHVHLENNILFPRALKLELGLRK
jgi:regulator of cell morphogenesis and NO signaling